MKLQQLVDILSLRVLAGEKGLTNEVTGGYAGDLLSCVMAGAHAGNVLVTLQGHLNVVAVASLIDLAGVIVSENKPVAVEALSKAEEESIPILTTPMSTYEVVGRLWDLGVTAG